MFKKNKKIEIITKSPFFSFVIKDFFNQDFYKELQIDLKDIERDSNFFKISNVKKYNITNTMDNYHDL